MFDHVSEYRLLEEKLESKCHYSHVGEMKLYIVTLCDDRGNG